MRDIRFVRFSRELPRVSEFLDRTVLSLARREIDRAQFAPYSVRSSADIRVGASCFTSLAFAKDVSLPKNSYPPVVLRLKRYIIFLVSRLRIRYFNAKTIISISGGLEGPNQMV